MSIFRSDVAASTLLNPVSEDPDFQIRPLDGFCFQALERTRYYSIIWIKEGQGTVAYEFNEHPFQAPSILFFAPYQPFVFKEGTSASGINLHFSSDFYCIERHQQEVSCSGVLFNNVYETPLIQLTSEHGADLDRLLQSMQSEFDGSSEPDPQLLRSYLKIFLIKATRIKKSQLRITGDLGDAEPVKQKLRFLRECIENNFRKYKSPSEYAGILHISTKALGRMVKQHFNKTLTELIQERIVVEAKRELSLTDKLVKEIAHELGYEDPFYFSRLFKKLSRISPEQYRLNDGLR